MDSFKQRLINLFATYPELATLRQQLRHHRLSAWLVGGSIRDLLLSRPIVDIDITVEKDPTSLAQQWAKENNGRWFWLDQDRLQSRVLLASQLVIDFAPLRAATIAGDQSLRDFTINSLALSLSEEFTSQNILDPLGGLKDLEQRTLQFCSTHSIADDPLRMLKGIRHAITLQMNLSNEALQQIKTESVGINRVAGERIRDELGKILLSRSPVYGFEQLQDCGLLQQLFGQPSSNWVSAESLADLRQFDQDISMWRGAEEEGGSVEEPYSSRSLFLLATFLRSYQPNNLPDLLHSRLRLSRQQQRIISNLQQEPDSHWSALATKLTSARQKALLVESLGYFPAEQLIYWSIYRGLLTQDLVYDLLAAYQGQQHLGRVPDILNGKQLEEITQCSGKEIGLWQQRIKQAELVGEIVDIDGARVWLKAKISN